MTVIAINTRSEGRCGLRKITDAANLTSWRWGNWTNRAGKAPASH